MRQILLRCLILGCLLGVRPAWAAAVPATASLVASTTALQAGTENWVALRLVPDPGWHTYWRNPGDSGVATTLHWTLPTGVRAGDIVWPYPDFISVSGIVNYGYEGSTLLLVPLQVPASWPVNHPLAIAAKASWLVCKDICVPGNASLSLSLPVVRQTPTADPRWAGAFAQARTRLPQPLPISATPRFEVRAHRLILDVKLGDLPVQAAAVFFPYANDLVDHSAAAQTVVESGDVRISRPLSSYFTKTPATVEGVLEIHDGDRVAAWEVRAEPGVLGPNPLPRHATASSGALLRALGLALLGGLLLNLMPCVFPILSIKAVALVNSGGDKSHVLAYTAGILASMVAAAIVLLGARGVGQTLGWGFQLQSPPFVAALAYLLFAMGLSLSGVLDFGTRWMGAGQSLTQSSGLPGSFFTGVLAVVVASPCTTPFMAPALAFALVQPPWIATAILLALGLGLALPLLLLAVIPGALRWLPRPGAWMESFRQLMAFPLYLSSVWLLWVIGRQAGVDALGWTLLGAVVLAAGLWARGHWPLGRLSALAETAAVIAALGFAASLPRHGLPSLQRNPAAPRTTRAEAYSDARLAELRAQHRTVFVDFTADWCLTCKVNERIALMTPEVGQAFAEHNVAWLVADWTDGDPAITHVLSHYGRPGVPLYLVYSAGAAPHVLPQLLTPDIVVGAVGGTTS